MEDLSRAAAFCFVASFFKMLRALQEPSGHPCLFVLVNEAIFQVSAAFSSF
jgi:hypothetical protein